MSSGRIYKPERLLIRFPFTADTKISDFPVNYRYSYMTNFHLVWWRLFYHFPVWLLSSLVTVILKMTSVEFTLGRCCLENLMPALAWPLCCRVCWELALRLSTTSFHSLKFHWAPWRSKILLESGHPDILNLNSSLVPNSSSFCFSYSVLLFLPPGRLFLNLPYLLLLHACTTTTGF